LRAAGSAFGVERAVAAAIIVLASAVVVVSAVRVLANPGKRWAAGSRWFVFSRKGEPPPSSTLLRFFAGVWLAIGLTIALAGIAIAVAP
jgi:hypothetical protein